MEIDWDKVWTNIPEIMGMPDLRLVGSKWYGPYYMNGDRHATRNDKIVVSRGRRGDGAILVLEQGGESTTLWSWMIDYGGVDPKSVRGILCGAEMRQVIQTEQEYTGPSRYVDWWRYVDQGGTVFVWTDPFFEFLCGIYPRERVIEAFKKYHVTTGLKHFRTGVSGTRFWYFDRKGRICHDKTMFYGPDGHRLHDCPPMRMFKRKYGYTHNCLFGEDSIGRGSIKVVESEKTAILGYLEFGGNWVACGGKNGLACLEGLDKNRIWLCPDVDAAEEWAKYGRVWNWWERCGVDVGEKWDIGDYILSKKR